MDKLRANIPLIAGGLF